MGRSAGFDFFENSINPSHTAGTALATTGYLANASTAQTGASLVVDTGSTTFTEGDVITIAGVNAVHPETKESLGFAKQFTVTADVSANATSIPIAPSIVSSGARQNVSNAVANNSAISKVTGVASTVSRQSMFFHKEAFAFATADLILPDGVHFAARRVMDGISMRIIRDYTISDDHFPCRIDVLYGSATLRSDQAVRALNS